MMGIFNNAISLRVLIQPLYRISPLAKLECLKDGLRITAVDDNDMCRGRLTLKKGCFRKYTCKREFELTLCIDPLMNFLKTMGQSIPLYMSSKSEGFELFYEENGWLNYLVIKAEEGHKRIKMDINDLPEAMACLQLNLELFKNMVRNMTVFGDELVMVMQKGRLSLSTQKLNHAYHLKPTKMKNLNISTDAYYRVAVPTLLLRVVSLVQSPTNYITIKVFQEGLFYLLVEEPNRYVQEFLITCRML